MGRSWLDVCLLIHTFLSVVLPVSWGEPLCCMMIMDPKLEARDWRVPRKFPKGYTFEVEVGAQPTETPVACLSFGFSLSFLYLFHFSCLLFFPHHPPVIPSFFPPTPVLPFMHPCSSPPIQPSLPPPPLFTPSVAVCEN